MLGASPQPVEPAYRQYVAFAQNVYQFGKFQSVVFRSAGCFLIYAFASCCCECVDLCIEVLAYGADSGISENHVDTVPKPDVSAYVVSARNLGPFSPVCLYVRRSVPKTIDIGTVAETRHIRKVFR